MAAALVGACAVLLIAFGLRTGVSQLLDLPLWVVMVACGVMGMLLYGVLSLIERRLVWWRSEA